MLLSMMPAVDACVRFRLVFFWNTCRYDTLVLELKRPPVLPPASALAGKVLGRMAYLNWPLMHEAEVVGISDQIEVKRVGARAGREMERGRRGRERERERGRKLGEGRRGSVESNPVNMGVVCGPRR